MSHGRVFSKVTATWPSGSPTSAPLPIPWGHMAGGILHISGAWTNSYISIKQYVFGQWNQVLDWQAGYTGVSIPSASANFSIQMPPSWFVMGGRDNETMLYSHNGTGSGIAQAGARTIVLELKD